VTIVLLCNLLQGGNMNEKILNATKLLGITSLLVISVGVVAETTSVNAQVEVLNAFNLTKGNDLNFGTVRATADTVDTASYTLSADPAATVGVASPGTDSIIQELTYGNPGSITIDGVANFSSLTLTVPELTVAAPLDVSHTDPASNNFELTELTIYDVTNSSPITLTAGVGTIVADSTGNFEFNIGGTISTTTDTTTYTDGSYTASFDVTVEY